MGQRLRVGKAGDPRDHRPRTEIQEQALGDEAAAAAIRKSRLHRAWAHEDPFGKEELEMRHRKFLPVDGDQTVDHLAFALPDAVHVHRAAVDAHAIRRGLTDKVGNLGASNHVLARQTGDVGT